MQTLIWLLISMIRRVGKFHLAVCSLFSVTDSHKQSFSATHNSAIYEEQDRKDRFTSQQEEKK